MEDARLIDLEIRLTHQEATLQALNDVIAAQQGLIKSQAAAARYGARQYRHALGRDSAAALLGLV